MAFRVFILAGGVGTRLAPFTLVLPKPLLPIGERPILDLLLTKLAREGCTHVTLCVGYLGTLVQTFCGDGSRWGLHIDYFVEEQPLGTVGALGAMEPPDAETFLVMNGDVVTDLPFRGVLDAHSTSGAELTIAAVSRRVKEELGVLEVGDDSRLVGYREKPEHEYVVSTGIYAFSRSVLDLIPGDGRMDIPDLALALLAADRLARVHLHNGYWLDLGRPDDFSRANENGSAITAMMVDGVPWDGNSPPPGLGASAHGRG